MNIKSRAQNIITEGLTLKALLVVSFPIILSSVLQNVLDIVDVYCIGNFIGESASAASSPGSSVLALCMVLVLGINVATAAFVSRACGAGRLDRVPVIFGHALYVILAFSLLVALVGALFTEQIIGLFGGGLDVIGPDVIAEGSKFLRPLLIGEGIMAVMMVIVTVFQSAGDSKTPMIVTIIINLINLGLNPLLITGFGLFEGFGIAGSAYASLISRGIGVFLLILVMYCLPSKKNSPVKFPKKWTFESKLLRDLILVAIPSSIQSGLRSVSFVLITGIITIFGGTAAMAAWTVCGRLDAVGFLIVIGLCTGVAIMVGQNLGAEKPERALEATKYALIINIIVMLVLGIVYCIYAPEIMQIFGASGEWLERGVEFMHIVPLSYFLHAMGLTMGFAMNGAGMTKPSMYGALAGNLVVRIGLALLFTVVLHLDVVWIWVAIAVSPLATVIVNGVFFFNKKWMEKKLDIEGNKK